MADLVIGRMGLCRDIIRLRSAKAGASEAKERSARLLVANRIMAIRRVLLGRPGRSMADEFLSPSVGRQRLLGILEEAKSKTESERLAIFTYANEVSKILSIIESSEHSAGVGEKAQISHFAFQESAAELLFGGATILDVDPLVDANIERGKFGESFRNEIAKASAAADNNNSLAGESIKRIEQVDPDLAAKLDKAKQKSNELIENVRDLKAKAEEAFGMAVRGKSEDSLVDIANGLKDQFDTAYAEYNRYYEQEYKVIAEQVSDALRLAREALRSPFADVGNRVIADILANSTITEDEAGAWAKSQEITAAAKNRLKKTGYTAGQVVADMAEFYRLTGGRITSVKIHSKGDKRANANDIASLSRVGQINIDGSFNRRVLWHELAHHIEADPVAKMAAGRLIKRRSIDGSAYSLRSLTGNNGFGKDEIAYKDGFFNEYVGKIYADGLTEVFSMGVESMSDPALFGQRMAQDPQTLEFVAGFLKAPVDPMAIAIMQLRESMLEMSGDAVEDAETTKAELLTKLAAKGDDLVDFTADDVAFVSDHRMGWFVGQRKWEMVAKFAGIETTYLFSGKVKRHATGRRCNGLIIVGVGDGYIQDTPFDTTDRNVIRAASACYRKNGVWPRSWQLENEDYLKKSLE